MGSEAISSISDQLGRKESSGQERTFSFPSQNELEPDSGELVKET